MEDVDLREEPRLSKSQIREGAPYAALSYVFFLWILTYVFKKTSNQFAHFHAKQGIVIFGGEMICFFLLAIPLIGPFFCRIGLIILFVMSIRGMVSALTGKMFRLSVVSGLAQKIVV
ncbi:MAG: hypothetical protein ABIH71_06120 [Candidatus Omnitrophota bacterium]|nr:hypothetical protein [Candidatus Omnitrophota bacterium]